MRSLGKPTFHINDSFALDSKQDGPFTLSKAGGHITWRHRTDCVTNMDTVSLE